MHNAPGLRSGGTHSTIWGRLTPASLLLAAVCLLGAPDGLCTAVSMNGPGNIVSRHEPHDPVAETSVVRIVSLGAIDFYRNVASPVSSSRCGFYPSCSTFGRQAVSEYGVASGIMMIGDRLTRCNFFKEPGNDYFLLPGGRLFDPVSANTLADHGPMP